MDQDNTLQKRKLPKLMACLTKTSLENMRNKALFGLNVLDAKGIRRRKLPLHECIIMELKESGYLESANYLEDLIYDNKLLLAEDEIGIVVDIRKQDEYLEHICNSLQRAEKEREKDETKKECLELLELAFYFTEKGKGILWLAEKFYLAAIAVSGQYLIDGGRQKAVCKYHYAKFLLEKFPGADSEESCNILSTVRVAASGKDWKLYEATSDEDLPVSDITVFVATSLLLHRVLLDTAAIVRNTDMAKAERLSRLAERRARDAGDDGKIAEAIIAMGLCQLAMNNLNNARKSFEKAFDIYNKAKNIQGLCEARMHLAAVFQKLGDHVGAAKLLTDMGVLAMHHNLRRQLGMALHLLGELHLRREKPELGTQHLAEAFSCFMGLGYEEAANITAESVLYLSTTDVGVYYEEAEQSRLTKAVSSGQEVMATYFDLLREGVVCCISRMKVIEWKLSGAGWWIKRAHHNFMPCMCPVHQRAPLDIIAYELQVKAAAKIEPAPTDSMFSRSQFYQTVSFDDIAVLKSAATDSEMIDDIAN